MKTFRLQFLVFMSAIILLAASSNAQNVKVEVGPGEIALNEAFTITVTVENSQLKKLSEFPDIEGMIKRGTSSSTSTQFINGQVSSTQSLTQNYVAQNQGTFTLQPFSITVNGETLKVPGKTIKVGAPQQRRRQVDPFAADPWEELFGNRRGTEEFIDVKADAFFALTTDKSEVYMGEGFNTSLAFYVSEQNRADLEFYDMSKQLTDILKNIRPSNCWEENFNVENIKREQVTINNKRYQKYLIYQATFFPLNTEVVQFPSVGLKAYKVQDGQESVIFRAFETGGFQDISIHNLKHVCGKGSFLSTHLKNEVAVGDYQLLEQISGEQLSTGESFSYNFKIQGRGNISAIGNLELPETDRFDLYPPTVQKTVHRRNGGVSGSHSFGFYAIPNEPGVYDLGDYFRWTYFNPRTEEYETLKSNITVQVSGESKKNETILATDLGSFYDIIDLQDNQLKSRHQYEYLKVFANLFILVMLVLTAIFIFRK